MLHNTAADYHNSIEYAKSLDLNDSLNTYRNQFHIPEINGKQAIY